MNQREAFDALELPEVERIAKVSVHPDDVIVAECAHHLRPEEWDRIAGQLRNMWPNNKIAICDDGMRIKVLEARQQQGKEDSMRPEDKGPKVPNPGQAKLHEITNTVTGEKRMVTQEEWRLNGQALRAEGFTRPEDLDVDPEAPAEGEPTV